ncbi:MAG: phenylalanine--tRNA ligase subunit beta [Clostridia bacterium]|nr:phenylalanine--tRNA ligase subunit beta [Clostridia bacterium]
MLAPLSWLKDFVDIDVSYEELEKKLFDCGFEVEQVIKYGDKINKVVTCKILEISQHPNAERLRVCQVDAGKYGALQIITNATNVKVGDIVPVAVDGATLATGDKIENGVLRGEPSYGMFCGGEEIGIDDNFYEGASNDSVLIFHDDFPLGEEVKELLGLEDYVFDVSVLANRPDCQSVFGLAREVACALGKPLKEPRTDFTVKAPADEGVGVTVEDGELCPRYIAHLVKNVKIEKSPKYISRRLALCGLNSINNIVDITNYVLLEMGQPMHAFDMKTLAGKQIVVRRAEEGEKIVTLDEKELTLTHENLVICDGEKPVALAGIMGGLNSEIKEDTNEVLFECAKFRRDNIRKSSRKLGKSSDSSKRFEKGVDEYTTELALKRALHLIDELGAGEISSTHIDVSSGKQQENKTVKTTFSAINGVLGIDVPKEITVDILKRLHFGVEVNGDEITTVAPPYREDVAGYPDLAEEVIRTYGYEHIVPALLKDASITAGGYQKPQRDELKLKRALVAEGFNEAMTYSFYSKKELAALNLPLNAEEGEVIILENPISDNYEVMRRTLVPSLLSVVSRNLKRANDSGRLFEIARVYIPDETFPKEEKRLSFVTFGKGEDFFTLKGAVESVAEEFGLKFNLTGRADKSYLHPGRCAKIVIGGEEIGVFGQVAYETASAFDIEKEVFVCEINYTALEKYFDKPMRYEPIPKFPVSLRDLALVTNAETTCAEVEEVILSAAKGAVKSVKLFDVYEGAQVGENKKSMAFTLTFGSDEKALSSEDVDALVKRILGALKHRLNAELR